MVKLHIFSNWIETKIVKTKNKTKQNFMLKVLYLSETIQEKPAFLVKGQLF